MSLTFVTAYLKIYEDEYDLTKTFEKRLEQFLNLLTNDVIFLTGEVILKINIIICFL